MKKHAAVYSIILVFLTASLFLGFRSDKAGENRIIKKEIEEKVEKMLSQMTLDEKIGQMTQVDLTALKDLKDIEKYYIGSVLGGGNSEIDDISAKGWADFYDKVQSHALNTRLKIPIIFGIDGVHGHHNVNGAVIFPHNIGLGATRNPELIEQAYRIYALEIAGTGIDWDFAPCIAVARDERWGRTYESFGETPELAELFAGPAVKGLQTNDLSDPTAILACAKHFVGDGGTTNGKDQGNTEVDEETLRKIHLPGYIEALKAGNASVMISYNSWNNHKLHGHAYLINDVLKGELGFEGLVVSDWAAIDQLEGDYKSDIEKSINAGLDMIMIPNGPGQNNNYIEFITYLKELVNENKVPLSRIDDAAKRILRIKYAMNLFGNPYTDRNLTSKIGSQEHREVARECVRQSLVLLKNENNALPLSKTVKRIHVAGKGADDLGIQCGGWTIDWQGKSGNVTEGGTTILQAVKNSVSKETKITFSADGSGAEGADAGIVVVGEMPYAEMMGDTNNLVLSESDQAAIKKMKDAGIPVTVVLLSGRPLIIEPSLNFADAFIAAWLPGTEGQGVADVLFGDYNPKGKLPHSWPKSMDQIPVNQGDLKYNPLFPYGFGLSYK